jgi:hypothetical protein
MLLLKATGDFRKTKIDEEFKYGPHSSNRDYRINNLVYFLLSTSIQDISDEKDQRPVDLESHHNTPCKRILDILWPCHQSVAGYDDNYFCVQLCDCTTLDEIEI